MGSTPLDLESLRSIFKDPASHIAVGKVLELELASDNSVLLARCQVLLQERPVVARVTWDACGPNAGSFSFPQVDDLVLLEFPDADNEQCLLTRRLSSATDTIPKQAKDGHMVHRALADKNLYLCSDTKILIGLGADADPAEPLVLGTVLLNALTDLIGKFDATLDKVIAGPVGIGNLGAPVATFAALVTDLTTIKTQLATVKSTYVDTADSNVVSKKFFTERG